MKVWLTEKKKGHETLIWSEKEVNELLEEITKKVIKKEIENESEAEDVEVIDLEQEENLSTEKNLNDEGSNEEEMEEKANKDMDIE